MSEEHSDVARYLADLKAQGIDVMLDGERLLCNGARHAITPAIRIELAARKGQILSFLQGRESSNEDGPLSYAQGRLWFLEQLKHGSAPYVLSMAQHIQGHLNTEALRLAFNDLVRRHSILRTTFPQISGVPLQRVCAALEIDLPVIDLRDRDPQQRQVEALRRARLDAQEAFDLADGPLLRARLYLLGEDCHLLLIAAHHMVADGWSVRLIADELANAYTRHIQNEAPSARVPAAQYLQFSRWQRERDTHDTQQADLSYWCQQLSSVPPVLTLPCDHPRPSLPSNRSGRLDFAVGVLPTRMLQDLATQQRCGLFTVLAAAYGVLLARFCQQSALAFGTPVAGRNRQEWTDTVGCFVNTVVICIDASGDPPFLDFLSHVRATVFDALDHQDVPFEQIVDAMQPQRDLSRNPLVQASIGLHNAPGQSPLASIPLTGTAVTAVDLDAGTVRFDLELDLWETADGLHGRLLYAQDLFDESTMRSLASGFRHLLESIANRPDQKLSQLALFDQVERQLIMDSSGRAQMAPPSQQTLVGLVVTQAQRTPDAVALACGASQLTYAELVAAAYGVSCELRAAGCLPGDKVGLCMARGPLAIIAMIGILGAGLAYVPLDPQYPPARLRLVVEDSQLRWAVTDASSVRLLPDAVDSLCLHDRHLHEPTRIPPVNWTDISPLCLAYVMYTSGSTGRPKGVMVQHRSVVSLLDAMQRVVPLGPSDVFLAVTTFAFDISVLEIFAPLSRGACLVVAHRQETLDSAMLASAIVRRGVTAMQATPAMWSMLFDSAWPGAAGLTALCGGEALPRPLAQLLRQKTGRAWNVYGPTEATVWSSFDALSAADVVTIGGPLSNTALHVLDEHLHPLPLGFVGEIWVAGNGVSLGYLGRPALTAERFVPDPFAQRAGALMYRTGDLGRRRANGRIECLGRIDSQIKLRGFRIEPGEIEAALLLHESVSKVVVTLRGDGGADQRLVAYAVPASGHNGEPMQWRRYLQEKLPAHLVPTDFVVLQALPTTPNGKLDRSALPSPSRTTTVDFAAAPVTMAERVLAEIWSAVLKVEAVSVEDNFFDLGGHSLLLPQLRAEIAARLAPQVSMLDLFRWPTIRAQARHFAGDTEIAAQAADIDAGVARQMEAIRRIANATQNVRERDV
ncbi:MAG: amino acid adenylation domain-containing protein [Gammaproteobacteria bacterium]